MNTITRTFVTAIALATLVATVAPVRRAEACGFYSDESAVGYLARSVVWAGVNADLDELAKRFPEVPRAQLALLRGDRDRYARAAGVKINNETAIALIVAGEGKAAVLFEVTMVKRTGYFNWVPSAIRRASAGELRALLLVERAADLTARAAWSASATLAKR